jgi:hypothetical protein
MRGLFKTLFGDARHVLAAALCLMVTLAALRSPAAPAAGLVLPLCLLAAAAYLARR